MLIVGLLVCGSLGVVAAVAWSPEGSVAEGAVERVRHGVTETGRVEVVTTEGQVHRVIRWRTKRSGIETQSVEGPLRLRTRGSVYFATPPEGLWMCLERASRADLGADLDRQRVPEASGTF